MCVFCVVRVSVVYNWFLSLNLFTRLVTDAAKWKVCFFFFFFTFVAIRLQIDIMRTVETNVRMCVYRSVHILMVGWLVEKTCPKNEQSWLCKSHTHTQVFYTIFGYILWGVCLCCDQRPESLHRPLQLRLILRFQLIAWISVVCLTNWVVFHSQSVLFPSQIFPLP